MVKRVRVLSDFDEVVVNTDNDTDDTDDTDYEDEDHIPVEDDEDVFVDDSDDGNFKEQPKKKKKDEGDSNKKSVKSFDERMLARTYKSFTKANKIPDQPDFFLKLFNRDQVEKKLFCLIPMGITLSATVKPPKTKSIKEYLAYCEKGLKKHSIKDFGDLSNLGLQQSAASLFCRVYPILNPEAVLYDFNNNSGSEMYFTEYYTHLLGLVAMFPGSKCNSDKTLEKTGFRKSTTSGSFGNIDELMQELKSCRPDKNVSFIWENKKTKTKHTAIKILCENSNSMDTGIHKDFLETVAFMRNIHSQKMDILDSRECATRVSTYALLACPTNIILLTMKCALEESKRNYQLGIKIFPNFMEKSEVRLQLCAACLAIGFDSLKETLQVQEDMEKYISSSTKTSTPTKDLCGQTSVLVLDFMPDAAAFLRIDSPLVYNSNRNSLFNCTLRVNQVEVKLILKEHKSKKYFDNGPKLLTIKEGFLTPKGISLKDYITLNNPLSDSLKIHFIKDLLWEVDHQHNIGFIHNDIKPDNIIVYTEYGNLCRLIDYEFCKFFEKYNTESEECFLDEVLIESQEGTEEYYPPEKELTGIISPKSDIYSLGLVFCDILLGIRKDSNSNSHSDSRLKKRIKEACNKLKLPKLGLLIVQMISKEKADRPSTTNIYESMEWEKEERVDIIQEIKNKLICKQQSKNLLESYCQKKACL